MNFRTSPGWVCSVLGLTALLTGCNLGPTGKWYTLSYGWPTVDSGTPISKVTAATLHPGLLLRGRQHDDLQRGLRHMPRDRDVWRWSRVQCLRHCVRRRLLLRC